MFMAYNYPHRIVGQLLYSIAPQTLSLIYRPTAPSNYGDPVVGARDQTTRWQALEIESKRLPSD